MTSIDDLADQVFKLTNAVAAIQRQLRPVDEEGLPIPSYMGRSRPDGDPTGIDGPRWQVGGSWTVIAPSDPDLRDGLFLRDYDGQRTGDVGALDIDEALRLAAALVAAARYQQDEMYRKRKDQQS
ncbi:hypothetical protein [Saccharopolyspora pogona]|uniref:hypothetical protein n=1 Tax=Saccharopolyspora pogona TaxID=333966 RepID=UPI0016827B16|nr:hypothetical protein [Saccharopolyspora pogona]